MKNKYILYIVCILWVFGFSVFAQEIGADLTASNVDASRNIMLARSSADYRVTPGDVYTLAYAVGTNSVSYVITVDTSYRIRVSNLGVVNGAGKTFVQLKNEVEGIVANNYPLSGVQLALTQPAVFRVYVNGEVNRAGEVDAWALTRLSSLVSGNLTAYASTRDISVKSTGGQVRIYDLFKAQRFGDMSQDPYIRPGDIVTFNRINRSVKIEGAVERPGTYQILEGENLKELIEVYANKFTSLADKTRATLTRYIGSSEISGDITYLTQQELTGNYVLRHLDVIRIPDITELRPAVHTNRMERSITISGAVRQPGTYKLMPHENLKELIEAYGDGFTPLADKTRATLRRFIGSSEISGDITYLTEQELAGNYVLQHFDTITIPDITELRPAVHTNRIDRTITINGAVRRPGTYQLMPHENLKELIEAYSDGFSPLADPTRMEMVRLINSEDIAGDKIFLTEKDMSDNYQLEHFDVVTVPSITQLRQVMFVEGAVAATMQALDDDTASVIRSDLGVSHRLVVQFVNGETYSSLVRKNVNWFTVESDTQNAYIIRKGKRIPINLNPILYDASYRTAVLVEEDDTLIIPFRQYFVTVSGAVVHPGRYPYIPDRNWEYYIGLAGGFVPNRNTLDSVTITDIAGKRLKKTDAISPETLITANTNHGLYYFNQYAPVVTTLMGMVTTFFSILIYASRY